MGGEDGCSVGDDQGGVSCRCACVRACTPCAWMRVAIGMAAGARLRLQLWVDLGSRRYDITVRSDGEWCVTPFHKRRAHPPMGTISARGRPCALRRSRVGTLTAGAAREARPHYEARVLQAISALGRSSGRARAKRRGGMERRTK